MLIVVGVLGVIALVAGGAIYITAHSRSSGDVPDAAVTVADGGLVRLDGATLTVPPGAVSADGHLAAHTTNPPPGPGKIASDSPLTAAAASAPVAFELTGATLTAPATLTFQINVSALPSDTSTASRPDAVWVASFDPQTNSWQPVAANYDASQHTVSAQVSHLSWWMATSWDWEGTLTRLRQALSAFDSGRAPQVTCTNAPGVAVTVSNSADPPILGCATTADSANLSVTITNNRGYAMVLQAPDDAVVGPPTYKGFEEFERNQPAVMKALGGAYLAPMNTLTYTLPLYGNTVTFDGAMSVKTVVFDEAIEAASAVFGLATAGYSGCILDSVARSGPAPLSDAPGMVVECFPILAQEIAAYRFYKAHIEPLFNFVQNALAAFDTAHDSLLGIHGQVQIARPSAPPADLFVSTGYVRGTLYVHPNFPTEIGIDNSDSFSSLQWAENSSGQATATGTLTENNCIPDCADGTPSTFPVQIAATDPQQCTVTTYTDYSDATQQVSAYIFSKISVTALNGSSPNPDLVGDSVFTSGCH